MRNILLIAAALIVLAACSRTPGYVIPEERMASLMADIYLGDAVVENDAKSFAGDSLRKVLCSRFMPSTA